MSKLPAKLKVPKVAPARKAPAWAGPGGEGPNGGVTQGLIGRYLCCKERARLQYIEGLRPADRFNSRMEYGSLWHAGEQGLASDGDWATPMMAYAKQLSDKYMTDRDQVANWYGIASALFPLYVDYWSQHADVKERTPLLQEKVFDVPYQLPSGRTVRLRGKWDAVDLVGSGKAAGVYLFETKTKGDINTDLLKRQLTFDLQTMLYLTAMWNYPESDRIGWSTTRNRDQGNPPILGVRYNVVRRPRQYQGKKETQREFLDRLQGIVREDPGQFFMRWRVEVGAHDVARFRRECLDPVLGNLCDDYEWWKFCYSSGTSPFDDAARATDFYIHRQRHFRFPFGVTNILAEGGVADLDEYLASGSELGLVRSDEMFRELT